MESDFDYKVYTKLIKAMQSIQGRWLTYRNGIPWDAIYTSKPVDIKERSLTRDKLDIFVADNIEGLGSSLENYGKILKSIGTFPIEWIRTSHNRFLPLPANANRDPFAHVRPDIYEYLKSQGNYVEAAFDLKFIDLTKPVAYSDYVEYPLADKSGDIRYCADLKRQTLGFPSNDFIKRFEK